MEGRDLRDVALLLSAIVVAVKQRDDLQHPPDRRLYELVEDFCDGVPCDRAHTARSSRRSSGSGSRELQGAIWVDRKVREPVAVEKDARARHLALPNHPREADPCQAYVLLVGAPAHVCSSFSSFRQSSSGSVA